MTTDKNQTIWKWGNTAHITKMSIEGTVALASLAGAITAILIATKVIAGPASLALVASPAGIAVLFIAAVYFAAAAYVSYQQMNAVGEKGPQGDEGAPGKDADFAALVGNAVKSGTIVEEKEGENDVQQLFLTLPIADYKELAKDNEPVHILLADGKVVELDHKAPDANATEYKIQLTSVGGKDQLAEMKAELGMAADSKLLKVAVSDKDLEALKNEVSTKLGEVAVNAALSKIAK